MQRTMQELEDSIRKMAAESIQEGVVAGTEQAIKAVFNKALANLAIEVSKTSKQCISSTGITQKKHVKIPIRSWVLLPDFSVA